MAELASRRAALSPKRQELLAQRLRLEAGHAAPPPIPRRAAAAPARLSFAQERLWFLEQWQPGGTAYNLLDAIQLAGQLHVAALGAALREVLQRHESLRTVFVESAGVPFQVAGPVPARLLPVVDLAALPLPRRRAAALALAAAEGGVAFDLARGPLLRARLLRLGEHEHLLVLVTHHIAGDLWSFDVLIRELGSCYEAARAGRRALLPELAIQYADWSVWQRSWLAGEALEQRLAYWRGQLGGAAQVLELPADRPRPATQRFRGGLLPFSLPAPLSDALRAVAQAAGATPFMVLLAAFDLLLHRCSGQDDLLVGSPVAGRTRPELAPLVGLFVNMLVLRADLARDPTLPELLAGVRESVLGALAHQDLPFEKLVDELQPVRDPSRPPLVQVVFVFQNVPARALQLPGLTLTPIVDFDSGTAKVDLTLILTEMAGGITGAFEYDRDLFDRTRVQRLAGQFRQLLAAISAAPERRLSAASLLSPAERHQLVVEWNAGRSEGAGADVASAAVALGAGGAAAPCLHQLFAAQAARTPEAEAVVCEGERLSYRELAARAGEIAARLRRLGIGAESRVGLCVERSLAMVVGILGILEAGGAYVPLDPAYPEERLRFILADSGLRVLLTQGRLRTALPSHEALVIDLDALPPPAAAEEEAAAGAVAAAGAGGEASAGNLAYIIYTSGSTGRPKGVGVSHGNVTRLFAAAAELFDFGAGDTWTLFHSHAFDFSVWELWGALLRGGRLVVVPYWVSRSPAAFRELLVRERVSVLNQTPSAFRQLVEADAAGSGEGELALRWVVFGGEALDPRSLAPWFARHGDEAPRLVNMYGITETTVHVTFRRLRAGDAGGLAGGAPSVIGAALADLSLAVLDRDRQPVPVGVAGELQVGGAGVARGYLGRPELTAERFVPDPWSGRRGEAGGRLYRSGDLARYLPNGDLEYLGRTDHQVKIRGFRIELGEIEAALAEHPAVRQAAVMAREDAAAAAAAAGGAAGAAAGAGAGAVAGRRLVAYFVAAPAAPAPSVEELRAWLRRRLPEHMLPAAFVALPALPLTVHGKIDRAALPVPEGGRSGLAGAYVEPSPGAERELAEIWGRVLGQERVGAADNFFALGGDSILSIRVRALAAERGLRFELQDLFRHDTLGALARVARRGGAAAEEAPALAPFALLTAADRARLPAAVEDAFPPSLLQLGMLFHSQREAASTAYHNVSSFTLRGPLVARALRAAVARLAARHPLLRTAFDDARFDEPLALVHRAVRIPLTVVDLRALPVAARERVVAARFAAERRRRFDWRRPPLLRLWVHALSGDSFELGIAEHHAIVDGWSYASMLAELFTLYFAELGWGPPPAPPPAAVFRDFVALERRAMASPESRRYWHETLAGHVFLALPRWPGRQPAAAPAIRELTRMVPAATVAALGRAAEAAGVPQKSLLLAVHLRVLALLGGGGGGDGGGSGCEVLTGLVANGRPEVEDGERALGLFLNTLPLRVRLAEGSWTDLARAAFAAELAALPHRRVPLAEIQKRESGGAPLFETIFNYVHFHALEALAATPRLEVLAARTVAETHYPLAVHLSRAPLRQDELAVFLQYDASQLEPVQGLACAELYVRALGALARDPDEPWTAAALLSDAERHQLVVEWNDTAADAVRSAAAPCLHDLFAAQAARSPEALAVRCAAPVGEPDAAGGLTYRQLDEASNRLAHWLRARGVGPEVVAGVLLERSLELIVALLGVLKAGGAYLPLDPSYPPERLGFFVADAAPVVVLSVSALAGRVPAGPPVVLLDADWPEIARASAEPPAPAAGPDNLAYVIYTSGSTGRPKGAMNAHRGIVNRILWMQAAVGLGAGDRLLQKTPASFDVSVCEIFAPLAAGARLVLARPGGHRDPAYLVAAIAREAITTLHFVPSMLRAFLDAEGVERCASVRRVLASGEELPPEVAARCLAHLGGAELYNLYGPTETAVEVTGWTCHRQAATGAAMPRLPIGRPIANLRIHLLDAARLPVPVGVAGELHVAGVGVGRGYLRRPELTAERFVPDPFAVEPGGRLYRTGDLACLRSDGAIVFLGRTDHQVKLRGYRIELGEIEAALRAAPRVEDAAVLARPGPGGDLALAAYVAAAAPAPSEEELRDFLARRLPEHMLPAAFVLLPALPLTPSGKLDRAALPDPVLAGRQGREIVVPRDAVEMQLVELWEDLLDVRPVGVRDDFFALGGHSLLALRLIGGIRRLFGRNLQLATLLEASTVEQVARLVRGEASARRRSLAVPLEPRGSRAPLFCLHPVGGNVLCYLPLARHTGLAGPVVGIQAPDTGLLPSPWTVEAMAELYCAAVREVQPAGPYLLAGWSLGGVVAFEMARQLAATAGDVALLAMLDVASPGWHLDAGDDPRSELLHFLHDLRGLAALPQPAAGDLAAMPATLDALLLSEQVRAALPPEVSVGAVRELFLLFSANRRALASYRPRPYGGRLLLVRAAATAAADAGGGFHRWGELAAGGAEIHTLAGDHYSLLRPPQVGALAELLATRIDHALAATAG